MHKDLTILVGQPHSDLKKQNWLKMFVEGLVRQKAGETMHNGMHKSKGAGY